MFMTRRKREELERNKREEAERLANDPEIRAMREMEIKMSIKRNLNSMKKQLTKFDASIDEYIAKAKKASITGNKEQYQFAKNGLKMFLSKKRSFERMVENIELSLQLNDMNKMISEFMGSMKLISDQMQTIVSAADIKGAQLSYQKAMNSQQMQLEALDAYLNSASEGMESYVENDDNISDAEIDALIENKAIDEVEDEMGRMIDEQIRDLQRKMQ